MTKGIEEQTIKVKPYIKTINSRFSSETAIYIGKLKIASYWWDSTKTKKDLHNYKVVSYLPFIRSDIGKFVTEEECVQELIRVANYAIKQLTPLRQGGVPIRENKKKMSKIYIELSIHERINVKSCLFSSFFLNKLYVYNFYYPIEMTEQPLI